MTMLDDETLSALLHELGDSFPVPASGAADTLRRVRRGDDERVEDEQTHPEPGDPEPGDPDRGDADWSLPDRADPDLGPGDGSAPRTVRGILRTHTLLMVAAALIVLLALAGGAAILGSSSSANRTALASKGPDGSLTPTRTPHGATPPLSTTTTIPQQKSAAPGTSFSANAPSSKQGLATSGGATATGASAAPGAAASPGASSLPAGAVGQAARIEQTGSLNLTVATGALTSTMNKLTSLASAYGGFVANSQTQSSGASGSNGASGTSAASSTDNGPPSGTVTLQVPVANFAALLAEAKSLGKPSAVTTKATDVTGQYVDLQARISALEASRQQYLTIMTKASSVGDVLAVQAQLDNLQSQIEQLQGQLAVMDSETAYSTLIVALSEPGTHHHHAPAPAASGITKAWHDSLHGFAVGVDGIIRLAGPLLFALLLLAALVLGGRLTWRRVQRHNL